LFVGVVAVFANGSNLHAVIHQYLSGKPEEELVILPANQGHWQSIESVLAGVTDVVCLERPVRHRQLQYCGVLDCVAEYRCVYLHACCEQVLFLAASVCLSAQNSKTTGWTSV